MLGEASVTPDNAMSLWVEEPAPAKHLSPMRETASALAPEDCSRSRLYAAKQRGRSRWLPDGSPVRRCWQVRRTILLNGSMEPTAGLPS